MINLLKNLFETTDKSSVDNKTNTLDLLCGLMIEAANTDGSIDKIEIQKINKILIDTFNEKPDDVEKSLNKAIQNSDNSKSLYYYTSKLNKEYTYEKKLLLIETLWEIILSDNEIHDYETSLLRRLSGLLYISDIDTGNARKRALNKFSK